MKYMAGRKPAFQAVLIIVAGWLLPGAAAGQIVLSDNNSVAGIDPNSQNGMYQWAIDGQNELAQQWFWYGIGNGAVQSIDTIGAGPSIAVTGTRELTATYTDTGNFSISIDYLLGGGLPEENGLSQAHLGETISIANLSSSILPYHFYEYSYFNLGGANRDIAQLGRDGSGKYSSVMQSNSVASLTETFGAQGAEHGEVAPVGLSLAKLNSGNPVTLGSPFGAGPVGPGAVTAALEWDLNIAPGASAVITEDNFLEVYIVPEPTISTLLALAATASAMRIRRCSLTWRAGASQFL